MGMTPQALNDIFFMIVDRNSPRVVLVNGGHEWQPLGSSEFYSRTVGVSKALLDWGIKPGDRVAILSENRYEWAIADFASLLIGAVVVPIYPTQTADQCRYVLQHSGARAIFVSSAEQFSKVRTIRDTTLLEHIALMDIVPDADAHSMHQLMNTGPLARDAMFDAMARQRTPNDVATLIYTSGTTGVPKGVVLTHGNLASNLECSLHAFNFGPDEVSVSFLPLSHITARHVDYAMFFHGITIAYCPVIEQLPETLRQVRPTFVVGVPRVYEKIYNQVRRQTATGIKHKIYDWALAIGRAHRQEILEGKTPNDWQWHLADRLLYSKLRASLGGRGKVFISGGAPLGRELAEWYADMSIRIHEGYGLTETSPVIALNTPSAHRVGTVGKPLSNVEVKIAADGEVLARGPSIFKGYWMMPEETANAFEGDWFKTGDIGNLDEDGFLSITDRKKDLIKTSGGKFIAPQPIENSLKTNPLVAEAAVIGDRRRFPAVIIAPQFAALEAWARENQVPFNNREELVNDPRVQDLYNRLIADINRTLAQFEKLKRVLVIPHELSVADGTLTPTLKLRRRAFEQRYSAEIDTMYEQPLHEAESIAVK
jgi:long-chain acyl-CoA synthetase